jgi:hypothetical protein
VKATPVVRTQYTHRSRLQRLRSPLRASHLTSPQYESAQRPCGADSPRSVSRGDAVGANQASACSRVFKQEQARFSSSREVEAFRGVCRLDGMLLGNQGSIRFTRVRSRPLEPVGFNKAQENS